MPALMTLGLLLLILLIMSFSLAPAPGKAAPAEMDKPKTETTDTETTDTETADAETTIEVEPEDSAKLASLKDTRMDIPPPLIFNQTWMKWVALATCLPLGLAMLAVGGMLIASTSAKSKDLARVKAELAQLK